MALVILRTVEKHARAENRDARAQQDTLNLIKDMSSGGLPPEMKKFVRAKHKDFARRVAGGSSKTRQAAQASMVRFNKLMESGRDQLFRILSVAKAKDEEMKRVMGEITARKDALDETRKALNTFVRNNKKNKRDAETLRAAERGGGGDDGERREGAEEGERGDQPEEGIVESEYSAIVPTRHIDLSRGRGRGRRGGDDGDGDGDDSSNLILTPSRSRLSSSVPRRAKTFAASNNNTASPKRTMQTHMSESLPVIPAASPSPQKKASRRRGRDRTNSRGRQQRLVSASSSPALPRIGRDRNRDRDKISEGSPAAGPGSGSIRRGRSGKSGSPAAAVVGGGATLARKR